MNVRLQIALTGIRQNGLLLSFVEGGREREVRSG